MSVNPEAILAAYKAFGLSGDEDFSEVRARFRALVSRSIPTPPATIPSWSASCKGC